ncbi:MAG: hypothetical protein UZ20_WS6002000940 [candidate division WS6 bacterium OLB21]|uniref:Uncharacterized protein n=1 Tax=candidate division WS6 bacterium OLB21 TaxID=1617427 RepID=A0A136KG58_9BACT|nr:MAG: hypothetical protein UZ20_WS6002000940 [candidate division WS6 bacterium OLB21]
MANNVTTTNDELESIRQEVEDAASGLNDENPDKVSEYFETKQVIKTLRGDLKDYIDTHELKRRT